MQYNITKKKGGKSMDKKFLKPREAAKMLGVSRHTVYAWIRKGKLKAYKTPGGRMMVSREEVENLFKEVDRDEKH